MMFCSAVLCGKRLYCWNTIPTLRRNANLSSLGSRTSMPSTLIEPLSIGTSALMQRMSVDLPEPDGPMTRIVSPLATSSEMPLITLFWPKDLWTSLIDTIGAGSAAIGSVLHLVFAFEILGPFADRIRVDEEADQRERIERRQQLGARSFCGMDLGGDAQHLVD